MIRACSSSKESAAQFCCSLFLLPCCLASPDCTGWQISSDHQQSVALHMCFSFSFAGSFSASHRDGGGRNLLSSAAVAVPRTFMIGSGGRQRRAHSLSCDVQETLEGIQKFQCCLLQLQTSCSRHEKSDENDKKNVQGCLRRRANRAN